MFKTNEAKAQILRHYEYLLYNESLYLGVGDNRIII